MSATYKPSACLAGLPTEILLDVHQHLDLPAVFQLSLVNRGFFLFYQRRKADILLPVLVREYSPFDEFVQIYTASADDIVSGGLYKPRKVVFKRFTGDSGLILSQGTCATASSKPIVLTECDFKGLLKQCRLVRQWGELFPQMRWFHQPEDCRLLRPHEQIRFRRALYRWWLYGIYFHGDFPRPRVGHPEPYVDDIRTSQMRYYSTDQLLELMDFVETIKDVVLHYICPRLCSNQHQTTLVEDIGRSRSLATSWNDQSYWARIIKTYAKLGPEDMLYYFNNIYSYPRKRLINEIHLRHPNFTFDQESIQIAIRCALDERHWLDKKINLPEHHAGGIIDFDDGRDEDRLDLQSDGSSNGQLPTGAQFIQSYSRYSPRGDDGSFLDDFLCMSGIESYSMAPTRLGAVN